MKLRPYQKKDYKELKKLLKKHGHVTYGGVTGYGKSVVIRKIVKDAIKKDERVLVIAPRRKLVRQLYDTLASFEPSIIMGTDTDYSLQSSVYVCSTATLSNRLKKYGKKYLGKIDKVIVDEVHINFMSKSMQPMMDTYWDSSKWIGFSATPIDERGYRLEGWDYTMYNHQAQDLIDMGYLAPPKVMVEESPDGLDDIGMTGGDYNERQLFELMSSQSHVSNVFSVWKKYAKKRKTMIFAVNIQHAQIIHDDFERHGVPSVLVHSNLDDSVNEDNLENFKHGKVKVLINVAMLSTGFDEPSIDALIIARPTKSRRLYYQSIGRGLRMYKEKKDCLILDLSGVVKEHGYPTKRYDFNKERPPKGANNPINFADIECPHCGFETQPVRCRRERILQKHLIIKRTFCPNCDKLIDEKVEDAREIKRLKLLENIDDVSGIKDTKVGKFVIKIGAEMGYHRGWAMHVARLYRNNDKFEHDLKVLYKKYKLKLNKARTSAESIKALVRKYEGR